MEEIEKQIESFKKEQNEEARMIQIAEKIYDYCETVIGNDELFTLTRNSIVLIALDLEQGL